MTDLADKIRKAREIWVTAGGRKWLIRRPTGLALARLARNAEELVLASVVGWELKEVDLYPGGGGTVPPFDSEAFKEWVEDKPDVYVELGERINDIVLKHFEKLETTEKN